MGERKDNASEYPLISCQNQQWEEAITIKKRKQHFLQIEPVEQWKPSRKNRLTVSYKVRFAGY